MNKTLGWVIAIIVIVLGLWFIFGRTGTTPPAGAPEGGTTTATSTEVGTTPNVPQPVTITYTDAGFSPKSVTVSAGQTVTWVNQSSGKMWVASDIHPAHAAYDGTALAQHCASGNPKASDVFDQCTATASSTSWSFTFTKAGTWKYHNHVNAGNTGSVIVTGEPTGVSATTSVNINL